MVNVARDMQARLSPELLALVREVGELAADGGQQLYLVGGAVRDLLLGRPNQDLDLVVEGYAPSLARKLGKRRDGKVVTHSHFGTATYKQGEFSLDIVTARSETYAHPGALPTVTPGTIKDDLFRRDFTINAMAVRLDPYQFGELVDPYGGKRDLDQGLIRVLHSRSFEDDPTRIWRTVRYEQRLGFALEKETDEWLRHSVDMISRVSGDRLRHELEHILKEECPEKALCRAEELGALQKLQANLKGNGRLRERFERARRAYPDCQKNSVVYLALLSWRLSEEQIKSFIERLRFSGEAARALRDIPALKLLLPTLESKGLLDSEICRLLDSHQLGAIKAAAIAADPEIVRQRLDLYLDNLRFIVPSLDGDDLQQMGVAPGKKLGRLLRSLKAARVDGRVTTREEEVELVRQWIARGKG